jgi:hypothetical protein
VMAPIGVQYSRSVIAAKVLGVLYPPDPLVVLVFVLGSISGGLVS